MGNTSRRPVQTTSTGRTTAVKRTTLTTEQLAPKQISTSSDIECPICFVTYEEYNNAACCKQSICTDCYLQLKSSSGDAACPFCSRTSFSVTFEPSNKPKFDTCISERDSVVSPPPTSSPSTYITPEQEKKLRSTSFDQSGTPVASKADRAAIEEEIRKQRVDALVRNDYAPSSSRSTRSSGRATSMRSPASQFSSSTSSNSRLPQRSLSERQSLPSPAYRSPTSSTRPWRPTNPQSSPSRPTPPMPPSPYLQQTQFLIDEEDEPTGAFMTDDDAQLLAMLQSILAPATPSMPNLDQLEELMIMEAIRQSMQESETINSREAHNETQETSSDPINTAEPNQPLVESATSESPVETQIHSDRVSPTRLLEDIERALSSPPRRSTSESPK